MLVDTHDPVLPANKDCLYCESRQMDDEINFLLRCNFHSDAGDSLIWPIAEHLPVQLEQSLTQNCLSV